MFHSGNPYRRALDFSGGKALSKCTRRATQLLQVQKDRGAKEPIALT